MSERIDVPDNALERVEMMEGILISRATGGDSDNRIYAMLRRDFDQATKLETPGPWHVGLLSPVARLFGPLL